MFLVVRDAGGTQKGSQLVLKRNLLTVLDDYQEHYNNQRPHLGWRPDARARLKVGLLTQTDKDKQEAILGV